VEQREASELGERFPCEKRYEESARAVVPLEIPPDFLDRRDLPQTDNYRFGTETTPQARSAAGKSAQRARDLIAEPPQFATSPVRLALPPRHLASLSVSRDPPLAIRDLQPEGW